MDESARSSECCDHPESLRRLRHSAVQSGRSDKQSSNTPPPAQTASRHREASHPSLKYFSTVRVVAMRSLSFAASRDTWPAALDGIPLEPSCQLSSKTLPGGMSSGSLQDWRSVLSRSDATKDLGSVPTKSIDHFHDSHCPIGVNIRDFDGHALLLSEQVKEVDIRVGMGR